MRCQRQDFSYSFQHRIGLTFCLRLSQRETCNFTVETVRTLLNAFENLQSWIFASFHNVVIAYVGGNKTGVHDVLESEKRQPTKMNFIKDTCPTTFLLSTSSSQLWLCYKLKMLNFCSVLLLQCLCKGCVLGWTLDFDVLNTSPVSTV